MRRPFCRDCADHDGLCPTDKAPCDPRFVMLTRVELDHVLTILRDASREGSYYGNRQQYWRRHDRIWKKLEQCYCDITKSDGFPLKPSVVK